MSEIKNGIESVASPLKVLKSRHAVAFSIIDNSDVGAARRAAISLANHLNFSKIALEKIAIIVSELASNLIKHATLKPQLILQLIQGADDTGIEILALDKGPGIGNIQQSLLDGYSTVHTSGTGLGAVSRLADFMDIYSQKDKGTVILARLFEKRRKKKLLFLKIGSVCVAHPGEEVCGDSWSMYQTDTRSVFLIADGLGHGLDAAESSQKACQLFQQNSEQNPARLINTINEGLRKTRGAAIAIASIDRKNRTVTFSGLGNINGRVYTNNKNCHLISHDGTAGVSHFRVREFVYPWYPESILILHSDGVSMRWDLSRHDSGLPSRSASMIASVLYRDFSRINDDVTIVVAKE